MTTPTWWQDAICYQIYPRSFADSNGDGIGDIPGIIDKLDYLRDLGVTALWLSPFYPSPNVDWGYDVADYHAVDTDYGTLEDVDRLIAEAHQRDMHIILDLVLNHTSDQHPWFQAAKSSEDNPYHDWYVWQSGDGDALPNDWESLFGGSAWEYNEVTDEYYYHFFFPQQPDLNWRNPAVKEAMFDVVRFWLDRGVDGFRLDALSCIYETEGFPNTNVSESLETLFLDVREGLFDEGGWDTYRQKLRHQLDVPGVHPLMQELRQVVDAYDERILLGETGEIIYYGNGSNEMHSVFSFPIISKLEAPHLREVLEERLPELPDGAWEANTVSNHDRSRSYSHFSDGVDDDARARVALAMVMFLRGTPVLYYGEEIGMHDGPMPDVDQFKDTLGIWYYHAQKRRGRSDEDAHRAAATFLRDRSRTPMQWRNAHNAGFSPNGATPWLPVHDNYASGVNVADQADDNTSMLAYVRELIAVRQRYDALRTGDIELIPDTGDVLAFWRYTADDRVLVALNMSAEDVVLDIDTETHHILYTTYTTNEPLTLPPYGILCATVQDAT